MPLTDGATDGQHRVWEKDRVPVRNGSSRRRLRPPNAKETVDLQHLGQLQVQPAAPRRREGYTGSRLTTAEPVRSLRRFASPSSARNTQKSQNI